jgi:centrosomal protein CEP76
MDLLPKSTVQLIPEKVLNDALTKEKKFRDLDMLRFYEYSSTWWNEYRSINGQFEHRNVKIYAESEDGQFLPVFCFLTPLNLIKGVDTPYHAARFVSLIPL